MKYYVIAGERSGDIHGGNLLRAIKNLDGEAVFQGFGGDQMQEAGCTLSLHYKEMSFMGFWEVLINIIKIKKILTFCRKDLLAFSPDVAILIDFAGFNMRMAKFISGNNIPVYYYISPKVWAWNQKRAWKIKRLVDRMFVILPFEKAFFKKYDFPVDYVGNPVCDAVNSHVVDDSFREKYNVAEPVKFVALLPGSRQQEIKKILPVFISLANKHPDKQFALAAVHSIPEIYYRKVKKALNITLVYEDTYNLLAHAEAAIVTSGTATLETALWNVPQVVVYKTSTLSYLIAREVIQVPYISLVNLIMDEKLIKELIQDECTATTISKELEQLLYNKEHRKRIQQGYHEIKNTLDKGNVSMNAARKIVSYLRESNN